MRWTSRWRRVILRMDSTTGGPMVRLGTKWPSMTSRWRMEAPPRSTHAISSARRAKSADRIEGTTSSICGLDSILSYESEDRRQEGKTPPPRRRGAEKSDQSFGYGACCLGMVLNHRSEEAIAGIISGKAAEFFPPASCLHSRMIKLSPA